MPSTNLKKSSPSGKKNSSKTTRSGSKARSKGNGQVDGNYPGVKPLGLNENYRKLMEALERKA
jgi:hypothetical protein